MLSRKKPMVRKRKVVRLLLPMVPKATGKMQCKKGPARDEKHLNWVRKQRCLICGVMFCGFGLPAIHAHHVRCITPRSMGKRVSDYFTVPLCSEHHAQLHQGKEEMFWWGYGVNPKQFIDSSEAGRLALEALES